MAEWAVLANAANSRRSIDELGTCIIVGLTNVLKFVQNYLAVKTLFLSHSTDVRNMSNLMDTFTS